MFIELVDQLRCPQPHEETWLVAAVDRLFGRHIATGSLGCPICRATYGIEQGALNLTSGAPALVEARAAVALDPNEVQRALALLDLAEPGGVVVLTGAAAAYVDALQEHCAATYLLVNPVDIVPQDELSIVWVAERLPLAAGSVRAAWLGDTSGGAAMLESLVTALRPSGRLVAPADTPRPESISLLAQDERQWVGAREAMTVSRPMTLTRSPRRSAGQS